MISPEFVISPDDEDVYSSASVRREGEYIILTLEVGDGDSYKSTAVEYERKIPFRRYFTEEGSGET